MLVPYRYSLMDFFTDWHISKQVSSQIKTERINSIPKVPSHSSPVGNPHIQGNHYILTSTIEISPLSALYTGMPTVFWFWLFSLSITFLRFTHHIANHWWLFSLLHNIALGNYTAITHSSVAGKLSPFLFGVCSTQNNGSFKDAHILIPENVLL